VLVADDQPDVRMALRLLVKGAGMRTEEAASPAEVLAAMRLRRFDGIILDLNYTRDTTSGREGLDLLSELRALDAKVPVIVMTAWGTIELAVEAMRRGASDFVLKPWDNEALLSSLQRQIEGRASRGTAFETSVEALDEDLAVARQVQINLLPKNLKAVPRLEYGGACLEARGVGGDYYDFLEAPGGEFAAVLADVSGKGISAALLMANLQATLRSQIPQSNGNLTSMLQVVNRLFHESTNPHNFATLFFSQFHPPSRRLRYVSCGHNPAILIRAAGGVERLDSTATVLGAFPEWAAAEQSTTLNSGDLLAIYSDGITEAGRDHGAEFGEDRLIDLIRRSREQTVPLLVLSIVEEVRNWAAPMPEDDLTVAILRGGAD
jgi:sigma-B regulation protein RsbU (phosphoserine phosphatase)